MSVYVGCPHCDDEIEFAIHRDYQGDGCWGMVVNSVELIKQNCDCEISAVSMNELENIAIENFGDGYPDENYTGDY